MKQIWTTSIGKQQGIDLLNAHAQWYCNDIEPTITYPFQNWADTGNNLWKQRNEDNDGWIVRGTLDSAYFGLALSNSIIPLDGWISGLTAAYASATSMTIAGLDVTDRIQKGIKIRYKQGGEHKYDFVSEVSFATDTTLTLMGGSTVENETITDFAYSNIANPIGWPFGVDYIEGSNDNGTWQKWVDGTLECWAKVTATYYVTKSLLKGWTYPVEFAAAPIVHVDLTGNAKIKGDDDSWHLSRWITADPYLNYANISVLAGHDIGTMTSYDMQNGDYQDLMVSAIGRWK